MIISHKHKYVFVELPQTASSAIAKELKANYDGHEILFKHALYSTDFLKQAKPEEKAYKVISGMRNPMDICVSNYFKFKTDHENRYSNPRSFTTAQQPTRPIAMSRLCASRQTCITKLKR